MTSDHQDEPVEAGGLRKVALEALSDSVERLLADSGNDELLAVVPSDFAERLMALAWSRQFDLDKARFRRELKGYFASIVEQEAGDD
jgi:hypothetical protein